MSGKKTVASIMWANNETGVIFPIPEIGNLVKEGGGILHTDAVQIAGKLPISVKDIPVDLLSISGHKLHAPKGIGALYSRRGTKITPHIMGGASGTRPSCRNGKCSLHCGLGQSL